MILSDVVMPGKDGLTLLADLKTAGVQTPVVMVSGQANIEMAIRATRLGAVDFLEKPLSTDKLLVTVENTVKLSRLEEENRRLKQRAGKQELVWKSAVMQGVMVRLDRVAASETRVCILGETGTGKELVAHTLHDKSPRRSGPFITLNCAAIPAELIESELFGHEKGAFTGAAERRTGCFELAEGGTLLLDEIGEMPVGTQAKLLRVLEDHKLRRLGSKVETSVDVRVLAATNKVPDDAVANGELRQDLYYRLNVFNIHMPALREHKDDIRELVKSLLADMNEKHNRKVADVSEAVLNVFQSYSWPGNVRELRNTLERAVIVCEGGLIETKHLPPGFGQNVRPVVNDPDAVHLGVGTTVEEAEKLLILKTLQATNNNKTRAAEMLGISLKTLHNKLKEYGRPQDAVLAEEG
jgi:DNA-binding NtrC family response regulator